MSAISILHIFTISFVLHLAKIYECLVCEMLSKLERLGFGSTSPAPFTTATATILKKKKKTILDMHVFIGNPSRWKAKLGQLRILSAESEVLRSLFEWRRGSRFLHIV